jgi:hypothetical protein
MKPMPFYLLIATMVLSACSSTNITTQPIHNANGQPIGSVEFAFHTDGTPEATDVVAHTSDGEIFQGKVITHRSVSDQQVTRTHYLSKSERKERKAKGLDTSPQEVTRTESITTYSSHASATLVGTKGHSMECRFTLTDPEWGMAWDGGIGQCEISDGRTIPVVANKSGGIFQPRMRDIPL